MVDEGDVKSERKMSRKDSLKDIMEIFIFLLFFFFYLFIVFFFSSRRRHTRLVSDWSSDVCSSDLH